MKIELQDMIYAAYALVIAVIICVGIAIGYFARRCM